MSEAEHNEYMRDVKWKTFWYALFIGAGLLCSGVFGVASIRSDISDLKRDNKADNKELRHYVDSLHHDDLTQFSEIWNAISLKKQQPKKVINDGCLIEKMVNGERKFVPVPCN